MTNSFTKIISHNFRGFKNVTFSFEDTAKRNKSFIVVYGQNGAGKSSLAHLFNMLPSLTMMVESRLAFSDFFSDPALQNEGKEKIQELLKNQFITSIKDVIDENKTIGTENQLMELEYHFRLGEKIGQYRISFSDERCTEESLFFRFDSRIEKVFSADEASIRLSEKAFPSASARATIKEEYSRLFGQAPFIGILYHFIFSSNAEYREKSVHPYLLDILSFFSSLSVSIAGIRRGLMNNRDAHEPVKDLQNENVSQENERIRPALELGLTAFFSSLSFNLKSVEYRKTSRDDGEVYSLYFNEFHGEKTIRSVPLARLSSGTRKLISLFFTLYNAFLGRTTVIDEVDNGVHDLIIANILATANENENGQLIFTTHNTLLMKKLPKSCIYFLDEENGEISFYSLDEFGRKVQEKTDVVGRYLSGLYGGAPFPNVPSMRIIKEIMDEELERSEREEKE